MADSNRKQFLDLLSRFERELTTFFDGLLADLTNILLQYADNSGRIRPERLEAVESALKNEVLRQFVGRRITGDARAYDDKPLMGHTEYMILLILLLEDCCALAIEEQAAILKQAGDEVVPRNQQEESAALLTTRAYLKDFRPPLQQRLADGKSFAERLPVVAREYATGIATTLRATLQKRDGLALAVADEMRQWSNEHGAYPARRLGRTELLRTHSTVGLAAARLNRRVVGFNVFTSPRHMDTDECDDMEAGSPYELSQAAALPPFHPNCVLPGQKVVTLRGSVPIEQVTNDDCVLTHKGRFRKVLSSWGREYRGESYRITTGNGVMELTTGHPVLTRQGWVEVDNLKPGDQILCASISTRFDGVLGETDGYPSPIPEPLIPLEVVGDLRWSVMPTPPVALDSNSLLRQSEVDGVTTNDELSNGVNITTDEGGVQGDFNRSGDAVAPHSMQGSNGDLDARITSQLGIRNLPGDIRAFSRIPIAALIEAQHRLPHLGGGSYPSLSSVASPLAFNSLGASVHGDTADLQKALERPEGEAELTANQDTIQPLSDVKLGQDGSQRVDALLFDAEFVPFDDGQAMSFGVGSGWANQQPAANGAMRSVLHDNLSSSSLDDGVGAGSRNPVVEQFMRPLQAQLDYTEILSVEARRYDGMVYNMHVEEDNTYTVEGHVVHNCICYAEWILGQRDDLPEGLLTPLDTAALNRLLLYGA